MPEVTQSLDIPAAPQAVWDVATDLSRYGEWNISHTGFPDGTPATEAGTKFREQITIMGMPGEANWEITEAVAPERTVWTGAGPMGIVLGTKLELAPSGEGEGEGEGTTVSISVSFDGGPLAGPMGATVAASAEKGAAQSLEKLKELVA
jgi:carbon monoxide dehydrogenase subunit G